MKSMMKKYIYLLLYVYCCVLLVVLCYSLLLNLLLWPAACLSHSIFCDVWSAFNFLFTSLLLTYRRPLSQKWVDVSPKGSPLIYLRLGWLCKFCAGWLVGHTIESVTEHQSLSKGLTPASLGEVVVFLQRPVWKVFLETIFENITKIINSANKKMHLNFACLILRLIGWMLIHQAKLRKWTLVLVESY